MAPTGSVFHREHFNGYITAGSAIGVRSDDEERHTFLQKLGFSRKTVSAILDRVLQEEDHPTRSFHDFVQGISAYAR